MPCRTSSWSVRPRWMRSARHVCNHPDSRLLGGGTDLIVNIRRGIVAPATLIDVNNVEELRTLAPTARNRDRRRGHPGRACRAPAGGRALPRAGAGGRPKSPGRPSATWAPSAATSVSTRAACSITRANGGAPPTITASRPPASTCHVAPKSRGICFATFSGDLAPALDGAGGEVDLCGPRQRARSAARASISVMPPG